MAASANRAEPLLAAARAAIDPVLLSWRTRVEPAVAYSLTGPGKRLRGALVIESYVAAGGSHPEVAEVAAAVEVIHAYSLVHDDLPCMDDGLLRRGRPTTHRIFGVPAATRAGFSMVPLAARLAASGAAALALGPERLGALVRELFVAAGAGGMIGGQYLDLASEGRRLSSDDLERLHRAKTGALIAAACVAGGVAAGAPARTVEALRSYGEELGLAFQIADDLLDATGTTQQIGKPAGRDEAQAKATFVGALGAAGAAAEAARRGGLAVDALRGAGISCGALEALASFVTERRS